MVLIKEIIILLILLFNGLSFAEEDGNKYLKTIGKLPYKIGEHQSVKLKDGRIFIMGNKFEIPKPIIFNPKTGKSIVSKSENIIHDFIDEPLIVLKDGRVLIFEENKEKKIVKAVIYNPENDKFQFLDKMNIYRADFRAVLLKTGKVLITGGISDEKTKQAELFNPETNKFELTGEMERFRYNHISTLLADGRVLISGGLYGNGGSEFKNIYYGEIYDFKTEKFRKTGSLKFNRINNFAKAILLESGKVLIVGDSVASGKSTKVNMVGEIFNPNNETYELSGKRTENSDSRVRQIIEWNKTIFIFEFSIYSIEKYLRDENKFIEEKTEIKRSFYTIQKINNNIIVIGGYDYEKNKKKTDEIQLLKLTGGM